MKKKLAVWQLIKDSLEKHDSVVLLYVLESRGSSPGRRGFFMAVAHDGRMRGSIGGGMMEHKMVELAKERLKFKSAIIQEVKKQYHHKEAAKDQSGMICSGEQSVFIYQVQPRDEESIDQIISCFSNYKLGTLELSPQGIFFQNSIPLRSFYFNYTNEKKWMYKEKVGYLNHLYIIGGGHCSLALSQLMYSMDFYIHLVEERKGLNTMEQNNAVHEKHMVSSYSNLGSLIPAGENIYVVVMTFGYRTDDVVIRALLGKNFKYFGVLGSKTKIDEMFAGYRKEKIDETILQKIHAPMGLPIHSQTPEEIAVSIAAEIIQVKNGQ